MTVKAPEPDGVELEEGTVSEQSASEASFQEPTKPQSTASISPQQRAIEKRILERQQAQAASKVISLKPPSPSKKGQPARGGGAHNGHNSNVNAKGHPSASGQGTPVRMSVRQFEALLRQNFINVRRLRECHSRPSCGHCEWRDRFRQNHPIAQNGLEFGARAHERCSW